MRHADLLELVRGAGLDEAHLGLRAQRAVEHPHRADDAPVLVVVGVEDQRSQRRLRVAAGGGDPLHDRVEQLGHALAGLGRDAQDLVGRDAEHVLDLGGVALRVCCRQVDLVEGGDDLEVVLEGLVAVGERLGLDPLRGVDQQDHAFAGGEAAADLVAEVDVAGRVDQVEDVVLAR